MGSTDKYNNLILNNRISNIQKDKVNKMILR